MAVNIWSYPCLWSYPPPRREARVGVGRGSGGRGGGMAGWGVNVMKDHIRKQTSRPDRRVRRTEAEAQQSEAFSPTQHRCTCKNFTVSKKTPEPTCVYKRKKLLLLLLFFFLVSLHAAPPAARRLCQPKRIKRSLFRLIPAGSVGVVCAALMWRRKAGRRVRGGEMHHHRVQPRAHRVEQGRTFIPFPPTRCRRIPPECRGNSNGSTVSISAVDHMMGDIKEREKNNMLNHSSFS